MASKEYNDIKNYLHNDVGLTRDFIITQAERYIQKSIDKHVVDMLNSNWAYRMIERKIGEVITKNDEKVLYGGRDKMGDFIKDEIKKEIKAEVGKRIDFQNIVVSVIK